MKFETLREKITQNMASKVGTNERNANGTAKSSSVREIFARALTKSEWEDKVRKWKEIKEQRVFDNKFIQSLCLQDEFLDVIYWSRQVFGILLGIIWGIVPLKGFLGLVL